MEKMTKTDINQILISEGFKKVGFWDSLFFWSRNKAEKLKRLHFNKGINGNKLALFNPDLYKVNDRDYLVVTNKELYTKTIPKCQINS